MPKLIIDSVEIEVEEGLTLIRACKRLGKEIPHFCFHEKLNIAGNCRMCLVEVEKSPKLIASCAMPVSDGMIVRTDTERVRKAREGVMELLLINHPLDCPVCDQGGECDLQDQAFKYGRSGSRFSENKRAVKDKDMGPLIQTNMTRCIHCTRCIRFATEVAGVEEIGAMNRGEQTEIFTYLNQSLSSELSGNLIDVCPVGALIAKPYAFKVRSWELSKTKSIDVHDALGSNIRIDSRGREVMRILPRLHEDINEAWISDKARFAFDGLKNARIDRAYIKKHNKFVEVTLREALETVANRIKMTYASNNKGSNMAAIAGHFATVESMFLLKKLLGHFNCTKLSANQFDYKFDNSARGNYLFNSGIAGVDKADLCLIIGADIRLRATVLNARIGRRQREGHLFVAGIGSAKDQTYHIHDLGSDFSIIQDILSGKHQFSAKLLAATNPIIIVGDGVYARSDGHLMLSDIYKLAMRYKVISDKHNGFNILHNYASMVGSIDIGFTSPEEPRNVQNILTECRSGKIDLLYLLGADEIDPGMFGNAYVVYHGHHGDVCASAADVIIPSAAYTEQSGLYVNTEGRVQESREAVPPPQDACQDYLIFRLLIQILGLKIEASNIDTIRNAIAQEYPVFDQIGVLRKEICSEFKVDPEAKLSSDPIKPQTEDYYMTDTVSRVSVTMAQCSSRVLSRENIV
jgi:NADH-quinone oxidoreductase subunit G